MEFLQFHPTGMIWPPSVQGILVTEGVRGDGGSSSTRRAAGSCSTTSRGLPRPDRRQRRGGWRYTQGDRAARRPPELLTRDHVSRCIVREIKEGGQPHGGVYLDISGSRSGFPNAEEHIKRKLPSMYHQFKQLADIDITREPMEVGPTTHYIMGGVRVDGDTQVSTVPGLSRRRVRGGHQRRQPPGWELALGPPRVRRRAGEHAARFARESGPGGSTPRRWKARRETRWSRSSGGRRGGCPYRVQHDLQR